VKSCENIYFVGMMGAGKTTIGRHLARRLKKRFVDCDHEIEARSGVKIPVIFEIEGESGFRRRESQMIEELAQQQGIVLATGGGAVLSAENRAVLSRSGFVVYLSATPSALFERTRHDCNRPLLQVEDPMARIVSLYEQRDPLYQQIADLVIEGNRQSPFSVVRMLERRIKEQCTA
jgi:shikimate kinase